MFRPKHILLSLLCTLVVLATCIFLPIGRASTSALIQLSNDSGTPYWYYLGFTDGDQLGTVLSPDPEWYYPIQIMSVEVMIDYFDGSSDSYTVRAHIYSIMDGVPGQKLGSSDPVEASTFYPDWLSIDLEDEDIFLDDDPFMVVIQYMDGVSGSTPSVLWGDNILIPVGTSFYYWAGTSGWYEHYNFWKYAEAFGYLMIRCTVDVPEEEQPPTPTPTPTTNLAFIPALMKNYDPSVPTATPTPTYTPIPRPTLMPTITPQVLIHVSPLLPP